MDLVANLPDRIEYPLGLKLTPPNLHPGKELQMAFTVTNLVGSDPSVGAAQTDPNLVNPWGIAASPSGPFWISDNGAGLASIYSVTPSRASAMASRTPKHIPR